VSLPGSPVIWIGVLVVALGAGAWLIYKRNSAASTGTTTAATTAADTSNTGTDAGQIGTIQSEIGDLQSSEAQDTTQVQVPNVVGMTQERAFNVLQAAGLNGGGAPVQPGRTLTVNAQAPAAGAVVNKGSFVVLQSSVKAAPKPAPKPKPVPKPKPKPVKRPVKKAA
jgi:beta-lactam-binding protein with PASTA domain